jgi:hypothetical protein
LPESPVKDDVESGEVDGEHVVVVEEDGSRLSVAGDEDSYRCRSRPRATRPAP